MGLLFPTLNMSQMGLLDTYFWCQKLKIKICMQFGILLAAYLPLKKEERSSQLDELFE